MSIIEVIAGKGALCAEILATLPTWFGMPESNADYIRDVETMSVWAAVLDGERQGFLALNRHTPHAFEVHIMGVKPARHRHGHGRALIEAAAAHAKDQGARVLSVKTLSSLHPDKGYIRTRAFYDGVGFFPIEEFPLLWGAEDPALMMLRLL